MQLIYFQRVGDRGWLLQRVIKSGEEYWRVGIWGWFGVGKLMACHRSAHCLPSDRPLMSANTVSRSRWSVSLHRFINVPGKRRRCTSLQVEPLSTCEETKRPRRRIPALDGLCIGQLLPCHDRSHGPNNRRHSTYEPAQPAELTPWALFAHKMPPNFWEAGHGLICVGSAQILFAKNFSHPGIEFGRNLLPSCFGVLQANSQVDIIMNCKP